MKPFSAVAIPHKDILEGRLTEDIFAADLWEVFKGRGPEDYRDPDVFFKKTYMTDGMVNLLSVAEKRLNGLGGDPIIQLQTPFGGGKTHALIALFHKAKSWNVNVVVIDGTSLDPKEQTIWGEIESQLKGKIEKFAGLVPPGREKLRAMLEPFQPLLILIDELLQYATKAAGIKVEDSNLAAQVLAFMHELTGVIKSLDRCLLVLTLPSSLLEHYDESAERLFQQMQKISGRMEKVYTPVRDEEISSIIRRRLFEFTDDGEAEKIIDEFLDYAEKEGILPKSIERSEYKRNFLKSYPFQPEVIDIIYTRWGSFPTFQRTRGVLRLLSLVVHSLKDSKIPFIRLSDFDLSNVEIRRELIKHIGPQYDSVVASDITGSNSGARKVDRNLGKAFTAYRFGTRVATAIFLYSFSGGVEKGATLADIKLSCAEMETPSSIIIEAVSKLRENLFFLQSDGKIFFSDQPNLNRILLTRMENISDDMLKSEEEKILGECLTKKYFEIYLWPGNTRDIPDTKTLKLVILESEDKRQCRDFMESHGDLPRVNKNTLFFLCPKNSERVNFNNFLRQKIAWETIWKDNTLKLTETQRREVEDKVKQNKDVIKRRLRDLYRVVYLPSKVEMEEIDIGLSALGVAPTLDKEIFDKMIDAGKIATRLEPRFIKDRYLKDKNHVEARNILESFYKTPGELRAISEETFKDCIRRGVLEGIFGYGVLENEKTICQYFKKDFKPEITEGEILIKPELCITEEEIALKELQSHVEKIRGATTEEELDKIKEEISLKRLTEEQKAEIEMEIESKRHELSGAKEGYRFINLELKVPSGKLSDIVRMIGYIRTKFKEVNVKVSIIAQEGKLTHEEYKEKIKEAINQLQMEVDKEEIR